jgi:RNA polymerase sigma factor (sigma-70 family)
LPLEDRYDPRSEWRRERTVARRELFDARLNEPPGSFLVSTKSSEADSQLPKWNELPYEVLVMTVFPQCTPGILVKFEKRSAIFRHLALLIGRRASLLRHFNPGPPERSLTCPHGEGYPTVPFDPPGHEARPALPRAAQFPAASSCAFHSESWGDHMSDLERLELIRRYLAVPRDLATAEQVSAWDGLVSDCNPVLIRIFSACEDHWDVIDDLRQEVWLVVVRKLPTSEGPDPALGTVGQWVAGIAKYIAARHAHHRSHGRTEPLTDELAKLLVDVASDPSAAYAASDASEQLHAVVDDFAVRLVELNRRILVMYLINKVPVPAIARSTGLTQAAVRMRLHRIFEVLREELRRRGLAAA